MRKKLVMMSIGILVTPILLAQSHKYKSLRIKNLRPGTIEAVHNPVKVTGEGMTTPSGVKYWDIRIGEGNPATKGHTVKVLYTAWVENGKEFASSVTDGKPSIFTLGVGQVIPGWEDGMVGMKIGGKRQLRIPPGLAYGEAGIPSLVPPNSTLIFDVELVEMQ